ncbi:MAG: glycine zipper 2TM domain-containing protein [Lysobacteraceae bacterium]|nr:glycine zipper 2TM domain-containing protein [Xanthomonadaceae bacterium]MCZ8319681.1 glycine zipper 2TM domain-containing protein [Silanimonas sp.]
MIRFAPPIALVLALAAGTASAQRWGGHDDYGYDHNGPRWDTARVVNVDPILAPGAPRWQQQCWQEPVRVVTRDYVPDRRYDDRRYRSGGIGPSTGQVLGGIIGAAVGNQVGDGDGRRAATVAGALLGSAIARDSYRDRRYDDRYGDRYGYGGGYGGYEVEREQVRYEQRCQNVQSGYRDDRVVGYRVTYDYKGIVGTTQTSYHPGRTIRVRIDVTPEG